MVAAPGGHREPAGDVVRTNQVDDQLIVGRYTGRFSKNGQLRIVFSDGRSLARTYWSARLALVVCAFVLTWATHPGGCQFTYHGHAP